MVFSVYSCVSLLFVSRRPTTQKTFGPSTGPGRICNSKSGPGRIWKNHIRCNPNLHVHYWQNIIVQHNSLHSPVFSNAPPSFQTPWSQFCAVAAHSLRHGRHRSTTRTPTPVVNSRWPSLNLVNIIPDWSTTCEICSNLFKVIRSNTEIA